MLLGDPPIDWATVTSLSQIPSGTAQRDSYAASVIQQEVLAKGRKALLCYGLPHLLHFDNPTPSTVSLVQQRTGVRTYTIGDLVPLQGDPGAWPLGSLTIPRARSSPQRTRGWDKSTPRMR